jgi:branched-chain amino acid transport system substrate-binding protein
LVAIGSEAIAGHLSSSVYFSTIETPENKKFRLDYQHRFPDGPVVSADAEASYIAGRLLSDALSSAETDMIESVRQAAIKSKIVAPQGRVRIDPQTLHSYLTPRIGISNSEGNFEILLQASAPVRPDPYLVDSSPRFAPEQPASWLRVVK